MNIFRHIAKKLRHKLKKLARKAYLRRLFGEQAKANASKTPLQAYRITFKGIIGRRITKTERKALKIIPKERHISRRQFQIRSRIAFWEDASFYY